MKLTGVLVMTMAVACGSSPGGMPPDASGGGIDAPRGDASTDGASPDAAVGSITVKVTEGGAPAPDVYVAWHGSDGAALGEGTTSASGEYAFANAPPGTAITIGFTRNTTRTIQTFTNVPVGSTIVVEKPVIGASPTTVGQMASTFPGAVANATTYSAANGCLSTTSSNGTGTINLNTFTSCVNAANQGQLYAVARNGTGPIAWSFVDNITVNGTTNVTLPAWSTTFDALNVQYVNAPSGADLRISCSASTGEVNISADGCTFASTTAGMTYTCSDDVPSGITESAGCSAGLYSFEQTCSERDTPPYATFNFDFAQLPARITGYTLDTTNVERPTATFTLAAGGAPADAVTWRYLAQGNGNFYSWTVYAPGDTTGTLQIPALPNSTAAAPFRLTGTTPAIGSDFVSLFDDADATGYLAVLAGLVGARRECRSTRLH